MTEHICSQNLPSYYCGFDSPAYREIPKAASSPVFPERMGRRNRHRNGLGSGQYSGLPGDPMGFSAECSLFMEDDINEER